MKLTKEEQRRNRIALWRNELTELARGVGDGSDLRPPEPLLDSLEADIRAEARREALAEVRRVFERMCDCDGYERHRCNTHIAAHDAARIVRDLAEGGESDA